MATRETDLPRPAATVVERVQAWVRAARPGAWSTTATRITAVVLCLTVFGLVMSFSASIVASAVAGDPFAIFRRQVLWALLGLLGFGAAANLHHRVWRRAGWWLLGGALLGLVLVLVPGIGREVDGSVRWIDLGPVAIQPSEIAKLATLLWLADVFARKRELGVDVAGDTRHILVPALPLFLFQALLLLMEPDLGTTLLIAGITFLVLWIEGAPMRLLVSGGLVVAVGGVAAALAAPYRFRRVLGWWRPEDDPLGTGFQLLQSLYALGSGGLFGLGLGSSRGKWNFIPNPETDFIFAIIGEELGLVGAAGVLLLFLTLLLLGLGVARRVADPFARTVAFGITAWIVGQALINVGAVTGLLPITGVTLPLVSVGGSSLVSTLVALGILVSIARAPERRPSTT